MPSNKGSEEGILCTLPFRKKRRFLPATKLSVAGLDTEKVKKEVEVKILEKEYEPSKFPHMKIIEKIVKISNDDKLGSYFHRVSRPSVTDVIIRVGLRLRPRKMSRPTAGTAIP